MATDAVLVLSSIQAAPAGKTYEVWVLDGETPVRAGLFPGGLLQRAAGDVGADEDRAIVSAIQRGVAVRLGAGVGRLSSPSRPASA